MAVYDFRADAICGRCGQVADGWAQIGDRRFCHGDIRPSCYSAENFDRAFPDLDPLSVATPTSPARSEAPASSTGEGSAARGDVGIGALGVHRPRTA